MDRRRFLAALGGGAGVVLAGCLSGGSGAGTQDYDVGTGPSSFEPAHVETTVGSTVVWRNTNSRSHTVTAYEDQLPEGAEYFASGGYDSEQAARNAFWDHFGGALSTGEEFSHTFSVAGTYNYFCVPHEKAGMVGSVVVTE